MASDANNDGVINSADALQIVLRYVGTLTSFGKGDWVFLPAVCSVSVACEHITTNVTALAVGDVNCDAQPSGGWFAKEGDIAQSVVLQTGPTIKINLSEEFELPVRVKAAVGFSSVSLRFQYVNDAATFVGVRGPEGMASGAKDGVVALAWFSAERALNLNENEVLLTLRFKPTGNLKSFSLTLDPNSQVTDRRGKVITGINLEVPAAGGSTQMMFALAQNYPNPFNPTTAMNYQISASSFVTLRVFNLLGKEVATLVNEPQQPGVYTVRWDASEAPSGVYLYQLRAGNFKETKKLVLVR